MTKRNRDSHQNERSTPNAQKGGVARMKSSDDTLEIYFQQIRAIPLLTFEDELALSKQIEQGDMAAQHKLVNANLRLVIKIARLYTATDVSFMDLVQEGNLGLMHAAEKYDYRKNVRFCTYANWWIRQYINRYLTNKRRLVRLPHQKEEILRKIQRTYHSLTQTLMHQPQNKDIAQELGISLRDVDYIMNMSAGPLPLETDSPENDVSASMECREDYTYNPEWNLFRESSRANAMRIINKLKDKEKRVLSYRYQLNGCKQHTLREIGNAMDISPETVRQIELKALQKIRSHAKELQESVYMEAM